MYERRVKPFFMIAMVAILDLNIGRLLVVMGTRAVDGLGVPNDDIIISRLPKYMITGERGFIGSVAQ